jgi:long-chain fatty acid transport protein
VYRLVASAIAAVFLSSAVFAPAVFAAGGFSNPYQSATAIGTALAGASARSDDAGFFYYNPATISGLEGRQTFFDVRGFAPVVEFDASNALSPLGTDVTADGGSGNMVPNGLAAGSTTVVPLGKDLMLGFTLSAPFASDVTPAQAWAGRYQLLRSHIVGVDAMGALSWQATPWLAVAAGIEVERMDNRFESLTVIPTGGAPLEARGFLKGTGWAAGPVAGLVLTPASDTKLGLSWKSGLTHQMEATAGARLAGFPSLKAHYDFDLPSSVTAGLEQRLSSQLRLFAEYQWFEWSRFKGFDIAYESGRPNTLNPVNWKDTWMASIGFGYKVLPTTELTAGVSYETAASSGDSIGNSISPDANKVMIGTGVIHDAEGWGRISLSYAHVFLEDAAVSGNSLQAGQFTGTLKGHIDMIGAGYTYKW